MENDYELTLRESLWSQFGASLDMLDNAVAMCPEDNWNTHTTFWYTAFHCLFWTDYYLSTDPSHFQPPAPFTMSEFDATGKKPERVYTKSELQAYLKHCRQKARALITGLNSAKLAERWVNDYKNYSRLEIIFYNMRHIQHHVGQLNLLLRQAVNKAPAWVSQSTY